MSILIVQRLALHQNVIEFHQQFNGAIRASLTALYDDVRRRATSPKNLLPETHTHTHMQGHRHAQIGLYSEVALAKK